ncbi:hypothetical protein [Aquirufa nivalisilvae]
MEKMKENASHVEAKEIWAKPELEIVSVKDNTLNGGAILPDGVVIS